MSRGHGRPREIPYPQAPPSHSTLQDAPFAQPWKQLPPSHSRLQVAPPSHCDWQLPPSHSKLQVAPGAHCSAQLPPSHSALHVLPPSHKIAQLPCGHSKLHVVPPRQAWLDPPGPPSTSTPTPTSIPTAAPGGGGGGGGGPCGGRGRPGDTQATIRTEPSQQRFMTRGDPRVVDPVDVASRAVLAHAVGVTKPKSASGSPFDALAKLRDSLPPGPAAPAATPPPAAPPAKGPARAVVRMERKGRGGKEATVIEQLGLGADELARWCRELKQALGCGGAIDGDTIVLQGDLRRRLAPVLAQRGVGKVIVSG